MGALGGFPPPAKGEGERSSPSPTFDLRDAQRGPAAGGRSFLTCRPGPVPAFGRWVGDPGLASTGENLGGRIVGNRRANVDRAPELTIGRSGERLLIASQDAPLLFD